MADERFFKGLLYFEMGDWNLCRKAYQARQFYIRTVNDITYKRCLTKPVFIKVNIAI